MAQRESSPCDLTKHGCILTHPPTFGTLLNGSTRDGDFDVVGDVGGNHFLRLQKLKAANPNPNKAYAPGSGTGVA